MTTVRQARLKAVLDVLLTRTWLDPEDAAYMAHDVVDALFPPDPQIDDVEVPDPKELG